MSFYKQTGVLITMAGIIIVSCTNKKPAENIDYKTDMMEADRAFSKMSEEKGMRNAMLQFIDSRGVLLRPNAMPLVGGDAVNYISQANDTAYTMTWEPSGGHVAQSGELGYTYGIYSLKPKNKDTILYGTYISVWKKQENNKWKFLLETGNEGVE